MSSMDSVLKTLKLSDRDFRRVSDVIYKHCGINLHDGKKGLVQSRLAKLVRTGGYNSFSEYIDFILSPQGEKEFVVAVDSLSTNLTFFFREKQHFQYLQHTYIPELISRRNRIGDRRRQLLAWSAACSSGEEPYSLGIAITGALQNHSGWGAKILATDISTRILEKARHGEYDEQRIEPLTGQQRQRFLSMRKQQGEKVFTVRPELRQLIRFRHLNLMEPWPFQGPFDVIFVRNVMIYFDKPTQAKLIQRFAGCLAQGGLLCIGHSESLTGIDHTFQYVQPATYIKT